MASEPGDTPAFLGGLYPLPTVEKSATVAPHSDSEKDLDSIRLGDSEKVLNSASDKVLATVPGDAPVDSGGLYPRSSDESKDAPPLNMDIEEELERPPDPCWEVGIYIGTSLISILDLTLSSLRVPPTRKDAG